MLELRGKSIQNYILGEFVGHGLAGFVYKATHNLNPDIVAAFKFYHKSLCGIDPEDFLKKLSKEKALVDNLNDARIPRIETFDYDDTFGCFSKMQYIEGSDLNELAKTGKRKLSGGQTVLPLDDAIGYIREALDILKAVHEKGYVHTDIHPRNLQKGTDGKLYLLDFGENRIIPVRLCFDEDDLDELMECYPDDGLYLPPEVKIGKPFTQQGDIYQIGITLHQLLTGYLSSDMRPLNEINPEIIAEIESMIRKATLIAPEKRYNAQEMTDALDSLGKNLSHKKRKKQSIKKDKKHDTRPLKIECRSSYYGSGSSWYTFIVEYTDGREEEFVSIMLGTIADETLEISPDRKKAFFVANQHSWSFGTDYYLHLLDIHNKSIKTAVKVAENYKGGSESLPFWIDDNTIGFRKKKEKAVLGSMEWDYFQFDIDRFNNAFNVRPYNPEK